MDSDASVLSNYCTGKDYAEKENLKEMGDVSSGMASTIIQIFLKVSRDICESSGTVLGGRTKTVMQVPYIQGGTPTLKLM
jgi:hypothetical protein